MPVDTLAKPYELCFHTGMNIEQKLTEHDYYEILFVLSGHLEMMTLQSVYRNTGPILALIPPRTYHCNMLVQDSASYRRYIYQFRRDFLAEVPDIGELLRPFGETMTVYELNARRQRMFQTDFERLQADPSEMNARLMLPLILYGVRTLGQEVKPTAKQNPDYIAEVRRYISEHFAEKLVAEDIARIFGVSRTKLLTDFHRQNPFTLGNYIMRERVARARKLLKDGCSVVKTAELAGFSSDTHLRYCFHAVTGMSPSEYKKNGEIIERSL